MPIEPNRSGDAVLRVEQYEKLLLCAGATFCIRLMARYARLCDNDMTATSVFLSITLAGTQHMRNRPAEAEDFDGPFYRDSRRRSVSISSIARSLDLPIETVRRKCLRLANLDLVERTESGKVIVTSRILARPDVDSVVMDGVAAMNILCDQIKTPPHATTRNP